MEKSTIQTDSPVFTSKALLEHWQGHRNLTRRVIEAFPEDKLFTHSIGGMRPFSELAMEMIMMAGPGVYGAATGKWIEYGKLDGFTNKPKPATKQELLELWDEVTPYLEKYWEQISSERFQESELAFGQYEGTIISFIFYFIDNEIHHRAQGYVYLRSLGIEPPFFWERN